MDCLYCGHELAPISAEEIPSHQRIAFDPWLGRLWQVCPSCSRWSAVPLEERWEVLHACERQSRKRARILIETEHLCLVQAGSHQLIRVGRPPRTEFASWRYSSLLDPFAFSRGVLTHLLALPDRPGGGNIGRDYHGGVVTVPPAWVGSPFLEHGGLL